MAETRKKTAQGSETSATAATDLPPEILARAGQPKEPAPVDLSAAAQRITQTAEVEDPRRRVLDAEQNLRERLIAEVENDLGQRYSWDRCNALETFKVYHASQVGPLAALKKLSVALADFVAAGRNLILYGTVGTGKDHLLAAMLYRTANLGRSCRWINGQEMYGRMRDRMDAGRSEAEFFRELCLPTVLGISDPLPPAGELKAWRMEQLYRVIDLRYRALKSTWLTLNVGDKQEADRMLGQQAFDRLQEGAEFVACFWPSWRERAK